jgi:hypothetical protein
VGPFSLAVVGEMVAAATRKDFPAVKSRHTSAGAAGLVSPRRRCASYRPFDLFWNKASLRRRIDDQVIEIGGLILPCEVGSLSYPFMFLTGPHAGRWTTWSGRATVIAGWRARRARAGLGVLGI